jgi:uncharacterized membrane protein
VRAQKSGVVTNVEYNKIVEEARRTGSVLELVPALGDFVPADAPLFVIHESRERPSAEALHGAIVLELERTLEQDTAYGVRLLVDIAQRSMADSPLQDPSTAVQAIDRLHDILRQLARRPFPDGRYRDTDGKVRLYAPAMSWEAYVRLAFTEIRLAGAGSPQVSRRLMAALRDLRSIVPEDRRRVVEDEIRLLESAAGKATEPDADSPNGVVEDPQGIGVAASSAAEAGGVGVGR